MTSATARSSLDIREVLSGRLGADGVRRVAVDPLGHVPPDLDERRLLDQAPPLRLLRTKYKPDRKLTAYYEVHETDTPVRLAVTWHADGRTALLVSPEDPELPQLARLSDRTLLSQSLAALSGWPVVSSDTVTIRPVRYRPGQRHVLHVGGGASGRHGLYVKIDRDNAGAAAVPIAAALAETLAESCPGARLVEPVGYVDAERAAVWRGAPGRPLGTRLRDGGAHDGLRLVHLAGRALRALHDADVSVAARHSVSAEVEATLRAGEHLTALLPPAGDSYRHLVASVVAALDRWPGEPATLTHGDVKCDNLLAEGEAQIRFLDLDRVSVADPALDLGKFLADLHWWCPPQRLRALRSSLRAGYGAVDPARWARADLLAVLFRAKLAARRCAVHDPDWESRVPALLAGAEGAFGNAGGI